MAYATTNPPVLMTPSFDNSANFPGIWIYSSTDIGTAVDAAGYITNALNLGMKVSDIVLVYASGTKGVTSHVVQTVTSTGADLSDGTSIGSTSNSD